MEKLIPILTTSWAATPPPGTTAQSAAASAIVICRRIVSAPGCNDEEFFDSNPSRDYSIGWPASQQTEVSQLTPQPLRHSVSIVLVQIVIGQTSVALKIAPPLKRAA